MLVELRRVGPPPATKLSDIPNILTGAQLRHIHFGSRIGSSDWRLSEINHHMHAASHFASFPQPCMFCIECTDLSGAPQSDWRTVISETRNDTYIPRELPQPTHDLDQDPSLLSPHSHLRSSPATHRSPAQRYNERRCSCGGTLPHQFINNPSPQPISILRTALPLGSSTPGFL